MVQEQTGGSVTDHLHETMTTQINDQAAATADGGNRLLEDGARPAAFALVHSGRKEREGALRETRPAVALSATKQSTGKSALQGPNLPDPNDGGSGDSFSPNATAWYNAVGNPRYMPQEEIGNGGIKTKRKLGSADYSFAAPVLSLDGRGLGVNLTLTYNSRLWNKDDTMQFNYSKGWPAAGWTFGYGRILENYDDTATGNQKGNGDANRPGNSLLIQPDGTRIHLNQRLYDQPPLVSHLPGRLLSETVVPKNLYYPDGTKISYVYVNNRLPPNFIQTRNGDQFTISYRTYTSTFRFRWAIDQIQDTLGRYIKFHYYGDTGYNVGTGKPQSALASVTAPDQITGQDRVLVQLEYQDVNLSYNFANPPPANSVPSTLTVVRKIYYPATGRGYLFDDFSSYGMARKISMRKDMNTPATPDGTEIAYTYYDYPLNSTESGQLNDAPKYTHRHEWRPIQDRPYRPPIT